MSLDVLIVDDHEPMRAMLRAVLERAGTGAQVRDAKSGPDALAIMAERPAQLVLCDYSMPGMSGLELVRALRAEPRYADVRVVMVSGQAQDDLADAVRAAGADAVLVKPVNLRTLLDAIDQVMRTAA